MVEPPPTAVPAYLPTLDPAFAASLVPEPTATRAATFTAPAPLVVPTYTNPTEEGKTLPAGLVITILGVIGVIGMLAAGIFAVQAVGGRSGLIDGNGAQVLVQLLAIVVTAGFSFAVSWVIAKLVQVTMGLRVNEREELVGLDVSQHGENAYGGLI